MRLRTLTLLYLSCVLPATAVAQLVQHFHPPKSQCCLQGAAQQLADMLQDWAQLGRYHDDDVQLEKQSAPAGRVVFMGDSITDGWNFSQYFKDKPYVNRGISGQTTPQMLLRMFPDVIDLHPAAMIVLAGTNDVAQNTGPETLKQVEGDFSFRIFAVQLETKQSQSGLVQALADNLKDRQLF